MAVRLDTSGVKFRIELNGEESNNRGIAGELIQRRAEKLKARFGECAIGHSVISMGTESTTYNTSRFQYFIFLEG